LVTPDAVGVNVTLIVQEPLGAIPFAWLQLSVSPNPAVGVIFEIISGASPTLVIVTGVDELVVPGN
jgi:hypothetical protein